ncbi:MAG TPA: peptidase inhibitor family I36 protein [Vicinamibacterales bacterium]|nr:peptidase inhibitor family I36 protein [Vicinamibacterales bacterium]
MKTQLRVCGTVVAFAALSGCEMSLPAAPSELTSGIIIYEHANYLGQSAHMTKDIKHLGSVDRGPCIAEDASNWNDCVSSVRVAPGTRATVYRDPDFKGESLEVSGDIPNLQLAKGSCPHDGLNDCVTSIRIGNP